MYAMGINQKMLLSNNDTGGYGNNNGSSGTVNTSLAKNEFLSFSNLVNSTSKTSASITGITCIRGYYYGIDLGGNTTNFPLRVRFTNFNYFIVFSSNQNGIPLQQGEASYKNFMDAVKTARLAGDKVIYFSNSIFNFEESNNKNTNYKITEPFDSNSFFCINYSSDDGITFTYTIKAGFNPIMFFKCTQLKSFSLFYCGPAITNGTLSKQCVTGTTLSINSPGVLRNEAYASSLFNTISPNKLSSLYSVVPSNKILVLPFESCLSGYGIINCDLGISNSLSDKNNFITYVFSDSRDLFGVFDFYNNSNDQAPFYLDKVSGNISSTLPALPTELLNKSIAFLSFYTDSSNNNITQWGTPSSYTETVQSFTSAVIEFKFAGSITMILTIMNYTSPTLLNRYSSDPAVPLTISYDDQLYVHVLINRNDYFYNNIPFLHKYFVGYNSSTYDFFTSVASMSQISLNSIANFSAGSLAFSPFSVVDYSVSANNSIILNFFIPYKDTTLNRQDDINVTAISNVFFCVQMVGTNNLSNFGFFNHSPYSKGGTFIDAPFLTNGAASLLTNSIYQSGKSLIIYVSDFLTGEVTAISHGGTNLITKTKFKVKNTSNSNLGFNFSLGFYNYYNSGFGSGYVDFFDVNSMAGIFSFAFGGSLTITSSFNVGFASADDMALSPSVSSSPNTIVVNKNIYAPVTQTSAIDVDANKPIKNSLMFQNRFSTFNLKPDAKNLILFSKHDANSTLYHAYFPQFTGVGNSHLYNAIVFFADDSSMSFYRFFSDFNTSSYQYEQVSSIENYSRSDLISEMSKYTNVIVLTYDGTKYVTVYKCGRYKKYNVQAGRTGKTSSGLFLMTQGNLVAINNSFIISDFSDLTGTITLYGMLYYDLVNGYPTSSSGLGNSYNISDLGFSNDFDTTQSSNDPLQFFRTAYDTGIQIRPTGGIKTFFSKFTDSSTPSQINGTVINDVTALRPYRTFIYGSIVTSSSADEICGRWVFYMNLPNFDLTKLSQINTFLGYVSCGIIYSNGVSAYIGGNFPSGTNVVTNNQPEVAEVISNSSTLDVSSTVFFANGNNAITTNSVFFIHCKSSTLTLYTKALSAAPNNNGSVTIASVKRFNSGIQNNMSWKFSSSTDINFEIVGLNVNMNVSGGTGSFIVYDSVSQIKKFSTTSFTAYSTTMNSRPFINISPLVTSDPLITFTTPVEFGWEFVSFPGSQFTTLGTTIGSTNYGRRTKIT
jgi:hypothetical protein